MLTEEKKAEILEVALKLLANKERYTREGEKPYAIALQVLCHVSGVLLNQVTDVLNEAAAKGILTRVVAEITIGDFLTQQVRYTL